MAPQRRYLSNKEGDEPQVSKFFDLICEDSWRNVYAGELEVRPPGAPTATKAGEHHAHLAVRRRLGRGSQPTEFGVLLDRGVSALVIGHDNPRPCRGAWIDASDFGGLT
jgi:hypothetical protein